MLGRNVGVQFKLFWINILYFDLLSTKCQLIVVNLLSLDFNFGWFSILQKKTLDDFPIVSSVKYGPLKEKNVSPYKIKK